jgi:D-serine deaminase-like pyridoxal phosphate-dependent protein
MYIQARDNPQMGTAVEALDTPTLLLDLDAFERNLKRMMDFFAGKAVALRPHTKTHKCPSIAQRQLEMGAIGVTCAKVSEAEVMAQAGVRDILVANQVVGAVKIKRLTDLAVVCDVMVAVDDPVNVRELSQACTAKGVTLRVLVEVDIGMGRCGVPSEEAAFDLARQVTRSPGLRFMGLMGYEGHLVMLEDAQARARQVREAFAPLGRIRDALQGVGLPVPIVSGGGTGTYDMAGTCPSVTEVQAGSFVLMDSTYLKIRPEFEAALTVLASVVSRPVPERIVLDAGIKSMTSEFGWPQPLGLKGVTVRYLAEEHAVLDVEAPEQVSLQLGDKVRFLPSHCCTTVNLYDRLHVIQDGVLVDVWPIAARGCVQ